MNELSEVEKNKVYLTKNLACNETRAVKIWNHFKKLNINKNSTEKVYQDSWDSSVEIQGFQIKREFESLRILIPANEFFWNENFFFLPSTMFKPRKFKVFHSTQLGFIIQENKLSFINPKRKIKTLIPVKVQWPTIFNRISYETKNLCTWEKSF